MKCQYCGGEIPDSAMFCVHCGQKVIKAPEPAAPSFAPEPKAPDNNASQVMISFGNQTASEPKAPSYDTSSFQAFAPKEEPKPFAPQPEPQPSYQTSSFQPVKEEPKAFAPQPEPQPSFQPQSSFQPVQSAAPQQNFQPQSNYQPGQPGPAPSNYQPGKPGPQPQNFQTGSFQPVQSAPQRNEQPGFQTGSFQPMQSAPQQDFQTGSFQPMQSGPQQGYQQPGYPGGFEPEPAKKKGKAGLIIGIIVGLLVIAAAVVLILLKPWKPKPVDVSLNDYATMTFDGRSGSGTYTFAFDSTKFVKDYEETIKWMDKKNATENAPAYDYYLYCVDGTFSGGENGKLKNGDTVTVTWKINEEWAPFFNANILEPYKTFTVEGLPEIEELDPFNGFELTFEGTSPYIDAYGDSSRVAEAFQYLQYKIDPQYNLSEGDTVTVTLLDWSDQDPTAQLEADFGVHPITTSKTYTVMAGGSYVTSASQIPQEDLDYIIDIGKAIFQQDEVDAGYIPSNVTIKSIEYAGNLFLTLKEPDYYSTNNALFCLYKIDISVTYKETEKDESGTEKEVEKTADYTYYYDIEYDDLILQKDGKINVEDLYYYTPADTFSIDKGDIQFYGYTSKETYLASFESAGLDAYTIENNLK